MSDLGILAPWDYGYTQDVVLCGCDAAEPRPEGTPCTECCKVEASPVFASFVIDAAGRVTRGPL